jgi:hypothetical protein
MQPQIIHGLWLEVEADGTNWIPVEESCGKLGLGVGDELTPESEDEEGWARYKAQVGAFIEAGPDRISSIKLVKGWGARLSAAGYLDCTEWSVFDTEEEAKRYLRDEYEVGEPGHPSDLSKEELEDIVGHVQAILWGDPPDPNHEWEVDDLERIADHMRRYGLAPEDF